MRVCFLVSELFAWGKYSGYGSSVRRLATSLSGQGIDVVAIVPRRPGQQSIETLDGVTVYSYPGWQAFSPHLYRAVDADIYHSEEATIATLGARRAMPHRTHIVTCLDPWNLRDWQIELKYDLRDSFKRPFIYPLLFAYYSAPVVGPTVRRMDGVYCQAQYLAPKMAQIYRLPAPPTPLPNPYPVPIGPIRKAQQPTVCYLARWDPRKRPEFFFELARRFPSVRFIAMGKAHNPRLDQALRQKYRDIPNLELTGFLNPFESPRLQQILDESWIMVNVAAREGLPIAYVESAAHQCAILSAVDADGFASRGGYHVKPPAARSFAPELGGEPATVDDYAAGLEWLLAHDRWRAAGQAGHAYVQAVHDIQPAVARHLAAYQTLSKAQS